MFRIFSLLIVLQRYFSKRPFAEGLMVFCIGVFFIGAVNLFLGWGMMSGDSKLYSSVSYQLGREGWVAFENRGIAFYYRLFPCILWLCRFISEENWKAVFSIFQCLVCGGYFLGVFKLSKNIFGKEYVGWLAILFLFPLYEFWSWSRFVLTDVLFSTSLIWFLYFVLSFQFDNRKILNFVSAAFCLCIVLLMRPVGFFAIFSVLLYGLYIFSKTKFPSKVGIGLVLGVLALLICGGISSYIALPEGFTLGSYSFFRSLFEKGVVVHDRTYYDLSYTEWLMGNPFGVFVAYSFLVISRFVLFWSPIIKGYSMMHLGFNIVSLFPVYVLALFKIPSSGKSLLWITLLSFTTFHSLTLIDYDHRYRIPLLGLLVVLAAGGLATLIEKYISTDQTS